MLNGVINYHRTTDVLWEGGGAVGVDLKWTLDISVRSIIMKQLTSWGGGGGGGGIGLVWIWQYYL